jgi:hypothetical protein
MGTKPSIFQPDVHTGKRGTVAVHPGMSVSHDSHSAIAGQPARGGNIARDSTAGKHLNPVPVHPASHRVTGTNIGAPKVTTLSAIPDASNPNALDPTKPGKNFKPVPPVPGQRSRTGGLCNGIGDNPGPDEVGANHFRANSRAVAAHAERHALGQRIIGEALDYAGPDHPAKLGR